MNNIKSKLITVVIIVVVFALLVGVVSWALTTPCPPGRFALVDNDSGVADIPEDVRQDASDLASQYSNGDSVYWDGYFDSLLEVYSEAVGTDVLLIFNSGGQGGEEIGPEWGSILDGVRQELDKLGYDNLLVIYARTAEGVGNVLKEMRETGLSYHQKARPLASATEFFTEHIEGIRVILLGESAGAMMANEAMYLLEENGRVYSIQTGTPFYYGTHVSDRSLVIEDNGLVPDSLCEGDLWTIFKANLGRIPTYRPEEGHFLFYMRTPGHIYTWEHPGVHGRVSVFLEEWFSSD